MLEVSAILHLQRQINGTPDAGSMSARGQLFMCLIQFNQYARFPHGCHADQHIKMLLLDSCAQSCRLNCCAVWQEAADAANAPSPMDSVPQQVLGEPDPQPTSGNATHNLTVMMLFAAYQCRMINERV